MQLKEALEENLQQSKINFLDLWVNQQFKSISAVSKADDIVPELIIQLYWTLEAHQQKHVAKELKF
jgi:hypothetical protein